jgi:sensor histidine kinase regulating citrate/malate metabolism
LKTFNKIADVISKHPKPFYFSLLICNLNLKNAYCNYTKINKKYNSKPPKQIKTNLINNEAFIHSIMENSAPIQKANIVKKF